MATVLKKSPMKIKAIQFDMPGNIKIKLEDGRLFISPLKYFPELKKLSLEKRKKSTPLLMIELFYSRLLIQFIIWKILLA
ncbi:MAG: hypothetical protein IPP29_05540 [Bacteroidetes bacterium]|nr:hypothetical protein [Bacteroidota bacterium]